MIALVDRIKKTGPAPETHRGGKIGNSKKKSPIPAPSPAGLGREYTDLWNRAWNLADWIDDPYGAPIEERRAKLQELDDLKERMVKIVREGGRCGRHQGKTRP